ncbi:hypothetical protein [Pontibacter arcticus]|uniref:Uncharacterized protein n=1 Tax=Pontibacter arcticus TaxID=2080288 RepID=A0A364RGC0_9BACT|nr:hypothetical protein [Pontibacter arcticus]RAU83390.1 hypothetical protein DP923_09320 [Pontibacter arcticus]
MINTILPAVAVLSEVGNVAVSPPGAIQKFVPASDQENISFSTTYGSVLNYTNGENAVSSGSGIFIGDYFVGLAENPHLPVSSTYIRY